MLVCTPFLRYTYVVVYQKDLADKRFHLNVTLSAISTLIPPLVGSPSAPNLKPHLRSHLFPDLHFVLSFVFVFSATFWFLQSEIYFSLLRLHLAIHLRG